MTVTAQFVTQSEDGTCTYILRLDDPEHLSEPVLVEALAFEGDFVLVDPIRTNEEEL
jgi:hypothetical protein